MMQQIAVLLSAVLFAEARPQLNFGNFFTQPSPLGGPQTIGGQQVAGHRLPHAQNNVGNLISGGGLAAAGIFGAHQALTGGEIRVRPNIGLGFNHQTGQLAPQLGLTTSFGDNQFAPQLTAGGSFEGGELRPFVAGGAGTQIDEAGNIVPAAQTGFSFNKHGEAQGFVGAGVGLTQGVSLGRPFQG